MTLAAELAARGRDTAIVDADTYGGAVAQACGMLDEAPGLAALARAAEHGALTRDVVTRHALAVGPDLRVVSGITRAARWPELPGPALDHVWDTMRDACEWTVVDVGFNLESDEELTYDTRAPQRNAATLSALAAADAVVAVGSAEPVGIQRLIQGLEALADAGVRAPVVAVNRVRAEVAGPRPEEAVADALARFARVSEVWPLPWDPRAADAATVAGQTLVERAPRSRLCKAIGALASHLDQQSPMPGAATSAELTAVRD